MADTEKAPQPQPQQQQQQQQEQQPQQQPQQAKAAKQKQVIGKCRYAILVLRVPALNLSKAHVHQIAESYNILIYYPCDVTKIMDCNV